LKLYVKKHCFGLWRAKYRLGPLNVLEYIVLTLAVLVHDCFMALERTDGSMIILTIYTSIFLPIWIKSAYFLQTCAQGRRPPFGINWPWKSATQKKNRNKCLKLTVKIRDLGENGPPFKILATLQSNKYVVYANHKFMVKVYYSWVYANIMFSLTKWISFSISTILSIWFDPHENL
jgi:hypothetical protein